MWFINFTCNLVENVKIDHFSSQNLNYKVQYLLPKYLLVLKSFVSRKIAPFGCCNGINMCVAVAFAQSFQNAKCNRRLRTRARARQKRVQNGAKTKLIHLLTKGGKILLALQPLFFFFFFFSFL